jgi:hypothetical protein
VRRSLRETVDAIKAAIALLPIQESIAFYRATQKHNFNGAKIGLRLRPGFLRAHDNCRFTRQFFSRQGYVETYRRGPKLIWRTK